MPRRPSPLVISLALALAACAPPPTAGAPRPVGARPSARPSPSPAASPEAPVASPEAPATAVSPVASPVAAVASPAPLAPSPSPAPATAPTFPPIVAGIAAEGDGQDPARVAFDDLLDLEAAADGSLWVANARTVWRLTPGQPLRLVAGGRLAPSTTFDGRPGREVGFARAGLSLLPDDGTSVLLTHPGGLLRLGADGRLQERWRANEGERVAGLVPRPDGGIDLLVAITRGGAAPFHEWFGAAAGEQPTFVRSTSVAEVEVLETALAESAYIGGGGAPIGAAVDGRLVVRTGTNERFFSADAHQPMFALHPGDGATEALDDGTTRAHMQDSRGRLYRFDRDLGQLYKVTRGGPRVPFGQPIPRMMTATALTATADGTVYLATTPTASSSKGQLIWRFTADATTLVAGAREVKDLGAPSETPLRPGGVFMAGPAELWAGDRDLGRILRIRPGQPLEALYGTFGGPAPAAGAQAAAAHLDATGLARDGQGRLVFVHAGSTVWRVEQDGRLALLYSAERIEGSIFNDLVHQVVVTKDGPIYVFVDRWSPEANRAIARVFRLDGAGAGTALDLGGEDAVGLGVAPDGTLRVARQATAEDRLETILMAVDAAGRATEVGRIARSQPAHLLGLDPAGRWWFETAVPDEAVHRVVRYDLTSQTTTPVAGLGAPHFAGDTPDDGLDRPSDVAFTPDGEAFVVDRRLIKRIPPVP